MFLSVLERCCSPLPQRYVVASLVMSGLAIQYINRLSFNLALTVMSSATKDNNIETIIEDSCEFNVTMHQSGSGDMPEAEFNWNSEERGLLLGAFFIGYIVTQVPGGVLADLYGPKRVLGYGTLGTAVCTLITPLCARLNIYLLVALRALMGATQGPVFPCLSVFIARWSLPNERNFMSSFMSAGVVVGAILGNSVTGFLLDILYSWDAVFYIYALFTVIWFFFWIVFSHDSPKNHPFISEVELNKISDALKNEIESKGHLSIPYKDIFTSTPFWAMIIGNFGHEWAFMIVVGLLPQYMSLVLHIDVKSNGLLNSLPYVAMVVISLSSAKLAELITRKGWLSRTLQCKLYLLAANCFPCLLFIWASYTGCNRPLVVGLFTAALGTMGLIYSCVRIVNVDMAPNFAGTLMSLMNGIGSLASFIVPIYFSWFTEVNTFTSWRMGFFTSSGIIILSTGVFIIWGSSQVQSWNFPSGSDVAEAIQHDMRGQTSEARLRQISSKDTVQKDM